MTDVKQPVHLLREKLASEIDSASWAMLEPHYKRGAIFFVSKDLDLAYVAACVALDNVGQVKIWLDNKSLLKVGQDKQEEWEENLHEKKFNFLIARPYVFIQTLT